ncbi:MAG: hypothetical protein K2X04_12245 [Burkholderiales bacterium]|nr:hypothetical protein [Burkholderiales bacterium]
MKQVFLSLTTITIITTLLAACGGGGGGGGVSPVSPAGKYLPAGNYILALSNPSPAICGSSESVVRTAFTSNGQGQLCNNGDCQSINLLNDPCLRDTSTKKEVTIDSSWNNCQLSSVGVLTAIQNVLISSAGQSMKCSYNVNVTPQS